MAMRCIYAMLLQLKIVQKGNFLAHRMYYLMKEFQLEGRQ